MALSVFGPLKLLNKSLLSSSASVDQMLEAVETVKKDILSSRPDESFHHLFEATAHSAAELDLEPVVLPRLRKPPKRYTGPAAAHQHTSAEEHYRTKYLWMMQSSSLMTDLVAKTQGCTSTASYRASCILELLTMMSLPLIQRWMMHQRHLKLNWECFAIRTNTASQQKLSK